MAIHWYGNQTSAESCRYGSLAVVWPLLERMEVAGIINRHLPADSQSEYDHGRVLSLLMAARLFRPVALVNVAKWAGESGADMLWDMPVEKITDDRLGKSLDALFEQRHSILASLALHTAEEFDVPLAELHYDPTHIVLHGEYEGSLAREAFADDGQTIRSDQALGPAHITRGRPMSNAPHDVRLIHAGLCTAVDELGPLPIFGHTVSGNQNGHSSVAEQLALIKQHLRLPKLMMISDRGTFSAGHLLRLQDSGFHGLAAAAWDEFRPLFDEHRKTLNWKTATFLSQEQQRRRRQNSALPWESYQLAVRRHELTDSASKRTILVRVIFVFSTADQKVAANNREKSVQKLRAGLEHLAKSVAEGRRNTDPAAIDRRVSKLFGKRQAARYFTYQMLPLTKQQGKQLRPPQRGCKRPQHRFEFSYDLQAAQQDADYDGYSALVTTAPRSDSADALFTKYKQQNYAEHANHQFKTPLAVHPLFLKSPQRVEAMVFLMMMALTAYFLIQRLYRQNATHDASDTERRTTTETLLGAFAGYSLIVTHCDVGRMIQPAALSQPQRDILRQLGFATPAQILSRRLPRAP